MIISLCGAKSSSRMNISMVPKMLNSRWMRAQRFASFLHGIAVRIALEHAPMLQPRMMNMQIRRSTRPCAPMTTRIETVTDEDCTIEVMAKPISTPRIGFVNEDRKRMTSGMSRSVAIAADIVEMPTKRRPKPITISPDFFTTWFGMKFIITAPANTKIGAIAERRKATRSAVTVVPMFAPRMMPQALFSAMRPEFTKVTAMTVAVLEDWITAVKNSPTRRPVRRLWVQVSRMLRSFAPATFSIPWLIMYIPAINRPRPPKRLTSIVSMVSPLIFVASSPQDVRFFLALCDTGRCGAVLIMPTCSRHDRRTRCSPIFTAGTFLISVSLFF